MPSGRRTASLLWCPALALCDAVVSLRSVPLGFLAGYEVRAVLATRQMRPDSACQSTPCGAERWGSAAKQSPNCRAMCEAVLRSQASNGGAAGEGGLVSSSL